MSQRTLLLLSERGVYCLVNQKVLHSILSLAEAGGDDDDDADEEETEASVNRSQACS